MRLRFVICMSLCLFGATEWVMAQSKTPKSAPRSRKTVYDFNDVDILGNLKKPQGATVNERPETYFRRLFDLDESFLPNIVRSVDDF